MDKVTKVKEIIAKQLNIELEKVVDEAKFVEDLGADSLDQVEIIMELEKQFGIEIPESASENIKTVGDAIKFINENVQ